MNKLKIGKDSRQVFDIEYKNTPSLLLKGIGKTCDVCGKHIYGRPNKKTCSDKCRFKKGNDKHRDSKVKVGLHAFISLKKSDAVKPYRIIKVYLKKGIIEEIKITPESKELWALLEKISKFRNPELII